MEQSKMVKGENELRNKLGFEQKEIEVNGKKYLLQNIPLKAYYQMVERCTGSNGLIQSSKMYDEIFEKVIISPKTNWEDFSSPDELDKLMNEVVSFLKRKGESQ